MRIKVNRCDSDNFSCAVVLRSWRFESTTGNTVETSHKKFLRKSHAKIAYTIIPTQQYMLATLWLPYTYNCVMNKCQQSPLLNILMRYFNATFSSSSVSGLSIFSIDMLYATRQMCRSVTGMLITYSPYMSFVLCVMPAVNSCSGISLHYIVYNCVRMKYVLL